MFAAFLSAAASLFANQKAQGWCEIGAAVVSSSSTGGIVAPYGPFSFTGTSSGAILPTVHKQGANPFVVVLDSAGNNVSGNIAINITSSGVVTIGGTGTASDTYTYTIYGGSGNPTGPVYNRYFMQSFPKCTVTVYQTGTGGLKATIYSTNTNTPLANPFSADQFGRWGFYATNGTYDVQISGGGLATPYTFGGIMLFDVSSAVAPSGDTQVIYNKMGTFGYDSNLTWNYNSQNLTISGVSAGQQLIINSSSAAAQSAMLFSVGGLEKWQLGAQNAANSNAFFLWDNVASKNIISVTPGASQNIFFSPTSGNVTINGISGDPALTTTNNSYIFSSGGFLSNANLWNAYNTIDDGAYMRAYALGQATNYPRGGYIDIAPITYNPYGSATTCYDVNGNPVQQPQPLNGISNFGTNDAILWVGLSPEMPATGCGAPLPVNLNYGLFTNSYFYSRGGLATDQPRYNAINTIYPGGGVPAGGLTVGAGVFSTLYPVGTVTTTGTLTLAQCPAGGCYLGGYLFPGSSTGDPAAGTIATTSNPWVTGTTGTLPGMMYYNTVNDCLKVANNALTYNCVGTGGGGGASPGGVHYSIQINNGSGGFGGDANLVYQTGNVVLGGTGFFQDVGGFNATGSAGNVIQALNGGALVKLFTLVESAAPAVSNSGQVSFYGDSTLNWPLLSANGGTYNPIAVSAAYSTFTSGHCVDAVISSGVLLFSDAGGACTTGGASGTVVASPQYQIPYYSSAGTTATVTGTSGLTFNPAVGTFNISGGSATGITMTSFSLTAAGVMQLTAVGSNVDLTAATAYNAVQIPAGGVGNTLSGTFVNYIQPGSYSTTLSAGPPRTTSDTFHAGALSYYSGSSGGPCLAMYSGSTWACYGGGSGSGTVSPAVTNDVAYYTGTTTVGGSSSFTFNPGSNLLTVTGAVPGAGFTTNYIFQSTVTSGAGNYAFELANSLGTPFLVNGNGDVSAYGVFSSTGASGGFNVTTDTSANSIQTIGGINACNSGTCSGAQAIQVAGTTIVNSSRQATFSTVVANTVFNSQATNSTIAFQTSSGSFQVDGYGDVSAGGSINSTGNSTLSLAPYRVSGTAIVDSSRNLVNIGNITASGTLNITTGIISGGGIQAAGYNVTGGYIGQTWSVFFPGGFTGIAGCSNTLIFVHGILVSCS